MTPVGVLGWDTTDDQWRADRRHGLGGSDIAAVLGFSGYRTPWQVWAEKTGRRTWRDDTSVPAELGLELEPYLAGKAREILKVDVTRTEWRTYAHPEFPWRRVSPDGRTADGRLTEYKTAGLASGWGTPAGWENGRVPLGFEFQGRWALHVMNADVIEIVALVAGMGIVHRTVHRDVGIELNLVRQVDEWYQRHIVRDVEPDVGAADNEALAKLYPIVKRSAVDLDGTDALQHWFAYREAREREGAAKREKEAAGAAFKALLKDAEVGTLDNREIVTWGPVKGKVDWQRMVADLAAQHGFTPPDPEDYRKPPTRTLNVKEAN